MQFVRWFETLNPDNLQEQHKYHNLNRDYQAAILRLREHGVMVNGSFVFGMDGDDASVFDRTVDWAITQGIETATFHILTPYPGTALWERMHDRITSTHWDDFDTRHAVFRPARMTAAELEAGYWRAYREFYRWSAIVRGAWAKEAWSDRWRHLAYAGAWKKAEPIWDLLIRLKQVNRLLPSLEAVLERFGDPQSQLPSPSRPSEVSSSSIKTSLG